MLAYILLNVTPESSDREIKDAYMTQSELYSPDRHPEQFKKIREAYEKIKTQSDRDYYDIFHKDDLSQKDLVGILLSSKNDTQMEFKHFTDYFKELIQ